MQNQKLKRKKYILDLDRENIKVKTTIKEKNLK